MFKKTLLTCLLCAASMSVISGGAVAQDDKSPWLVRLRLIDVKPEESSTLSIGGSAEVNHKIVPELDITYFWTDNFATELILATSPHDVRAVGTAVGDVDLGDAWVLPPTLLAQYHFNPEGKVRPYLGAGINYTIFHSEDSGAVDNISYDNGFGYAFQAGMDIGINDHWAFNLDVKKLFLNTDVEINAGAITGDVDLDPWVFGAGFAYRF